VTSQFLYAANGLLQRRWTRGVRRAIVLLLPETLPTGVARILRCYRFIGYVACLWLIACGRKDRSAWLLFMLTA
jgi:hypothetical protein